MNGGNTSDETDGEEARCNLMGQWNMEVDKHGGGKTDDEDECRGLIHALMDEYN